MNSLLDKLNKNNNTVRVNGQLQSTGDHELQQMAQDQNRVIPTSPLAAKMMGASDDVAKMAGTKSQKTAAIDINANINPNQQLSTVQRQQQARTQATGSEAYTIEKSENLAKAGSIGDSVHKLIQSYIPQQGAADTQQVESYSLNLAEGMEDTLDEATLAELQAFAQNPNDLALAGQISQKLAAAGYTGDDINPLKYIATADIAGSAADQIADASSVTVGSLFENGQLEDSIGMNQLQLAELLGIDPTEAATLSLSDLQKKVQQVEQKEFQKTEELRNILKTGTYSEKQQAREKLRDLGAVGIIASEDTVDNLIGELESSDVVQFGDEAYTVEEMLADENISKLVNEYLEADDTSKQSFIDKYGQDFANFVDRHSDILESAADDLEATNDSVKDIQEQNEKLAEIEGYGKINSELMELLVPGYGEFGFDKLDPTPLLEALNSEGLDSDDKRNVVDALSALQSQNPELVKELGTYDISKLKALGATDSTSNKWANYVDFLITDDKLNGIDPEDPDYENTILESFFEGPVDVSEVQKQLDLFNTLGVGSDRFEDVPESIGIFDSDGDGQIDDIETLRSNLEGNTNALTSNDLDVNASDFYGKMAPYSEQLEDGILDNDEIIDISKSPDGVEALRELAQWNDEVAEYLQNDVEFGNRQTHETFYNAFPIKDEEGNLDPIHTYLHLSLDEFTASKPKAGIRVRSEKGLFSDEYVTLDNGSALTVNDYNTATKEINSSLQKLQDMIESEQGYVVNTEYLNQMKQKLEDRKTELVAYQKNAQEADRAYRYNWEKKKGTN